MGCPRAAATSTRTRWSRRPIRDSPRWSRARSSRRARARSRRPIRTSAWRSRTPSSRPTRSIRTTWVPPMTTCARSSRTRSGGRVSCEGRALVEAATVERPAGVTERARSERRLGWMLCAPAVIAMLLVTAYPICYAIALSLQNLDLRFPDESSWAGLDNYEAVLTSTLWWQDVLNTVVITVVSVALELTLGMAIALVMYRAVFGRALVRTSVLIPYGIVTVVAAFAWQFAFSPDTGFVNPALGIDKAWFGGHDSALAVIIFAEVWKTTPFMALLLLAGL